MCFRDKMVAGQRMADQDRIGFVRVQLAIGLVSERERSQLDTAIKAQLLVSPKLDTLTRKRHYFGRRHGRIAKVEAGARQSFLIWRRTVGNC
jgi:hypothetical protein